MSVVEQKTKYNYSRLNIQDYTASVLAIIVITAKRNKKLIKLKI